MVCHWSVCGKMDVTANIILIYCNVGWICGPPSFVNIPISAPLCFYPMLSPFDLFWWGFSSFWGPGTDSCIVVPSILTVMILSVASLRGKRTKVVKKWMTWIQHISCIMKLYFITMWDLQPFLLWSFGLHYVQSMISVSLLYSSLSRWIIQVMKIICCFTAQTVW